VIGRILYFTAFSAGIGHRHDGRAARHLPGAHWRLRRRRFGLVISSGLAGATLAVFAGDACGDRLRPSPPVILAALLSSLGGVAAAFYSSPVAVGIAAFVGMLNGMGRDRGASLVLEQAIIRPTVSDSGAHPHLRVVQRAAGCRPCAGRPAGGDSFGFAPVRRGRRAGVGSRVGRAALVFSCSAA